MTRNEEAIISFLPGSFYVHTSLVFNPQTKSFQKDVTFIINPRTGIIEDIQPNPAPLTDIISPPDIDLRNMTVLPGLVDAHTHIFLHPYEETPPYSQMRDESLVERIVRATNHVRQALMAGYTTYRDLGTEGLGDADVSFRDTINRGIITGPRLFVATQVLASSGGYEVRHENRIGGTSVPAISDPVDGITAARAGVRRRIGAGCDIIKIYAGKLRLSCLLAKI
jgi:imidazolonepropionase-like amidohydrolase